MKKEKEKVIKDTEKRGNERGKGIKRRKRKERSLLEGKTLKGKKTNEK